MINKSKEDNHWRNSSMEELLLDNEFCKQARLNYPNKTEAWEQLLNNAGNDSLAQAYCLINGLKIDLKHAPSYVRERDYTKLMAAVRSRRSMRRLVAFASAVACGLLIVIGAQRGIGLITPKAIPVAKESAEDLLDKMRVDGDSIQLTARGKKLLSIASNSAIRQQPDGKLLIDAVPGSNAPMHIDTKGEKQIQLVVPYGKRLRVEFEDGSKAWLNAGSKLIYPAEFDADKREIYLDGEIYLDVTKSTFPFVVNTRNVQVKVLGTQLNISAYKADQSTEVVLVKGSVAVRYNDTVKMLEPNMLLQYQEGVAQTSKVKTQNYTCWREGYLRVDNESLQEIFVKLSRHYNVQIQTDTLLSSKRYRGKLDLNVPIDGVFKSIGRLVPIAVGKESDKMFRVRKKTSV